MDIPAGAEREIQGIVEEGLAKWRAAKQKADPHGFITVADEFAMSRCITELERAKRGLPLQTGSGQQGVGASVMSDELQAQDRLCIGGPSAPNNLAPAVGFFERQVLPREEIIEGLLREKQLAAFAGPFTVGKSPLMADLIVHRVHGIAWCGHRVRVGPVIVVDLENERGAWSRNVRNIAHRLGVRFPHVPDEIDVYLLNDELSEPATSQLLKTLESKSIDPRLKLLEDALARKPDALVIIDPVDLLFPIKKNENTQVLGLFKKLKQLLTRYPQSAIILTFNLRKQDRRSPRPSLLSAPRDWLEEIAGSLDLCNRSDVRIGMDFHDDADGVRVINGVRRNEEMRPLLVRPIALNCDAQTLAGFELVPTNEVGLRTLLTPRQLTHWRALPPQWRFDEVADKVVPRATLFRIIQRVGSLALEEKEGVYRKLVD